MSRQEKIAIIDDARARLAKSYAGYWEYKRSEYLDRAAQYATIMSAMLADLNNG